MLLDSPRPPYARPDRLGRRISSYVGIYMNGLSSHGSSDAKRDSLAPAVTCRPARRISGDRRWRGAHYPGFSTSAVWAAAAARCSSACSGSFPGCARWVRPCTCGSVASWRGTAAGAVSRSACARSGTRSPTWHSAAGTMSTSRASSNWRPPSTGPGSSRCCSPRRCVLPCTAGWSNMWPTTRRCTVRSGWLAAAR